MRQSLRWYALSIAGGLIAAVVSGVVGEWFIELARENQLYDSPSAQMDAAMSAFNSFVTQTWFLLMTATVVGIAFGLWADLFLRRRHLTAFEHTRLSDYELGELCTTTCEEIHEYISLAVEMTILYKEETKNLRQDTWSEDIKRMQETARIDRAKFRKKFGSRLFYIEDELARRTIRRLALTERELDSMDERGQLADEIGAVGFRLRAGRKPKPPSGIA